MLLLNPAQRQQRDDLIFERVVAIYRADQHDGFALDGWSKPELTIL
jgi:hypothetical protein